MKIVSTLKYDKDGLIPAVVQDSATKQVLMLAYMSAETLQRTLETGQTYFWSRSRQQVWHKGETSGNIQEVVDIKLDCDGDALLILVNPAGPACHTGKMTCFHNRVTL
jgi:phosphoribosyl-AMP cyclohydrolase